MRRSSNEYQHEVPEISYIASFVALMFWINSLQFASVRKFNYSLAQIQFSWRVILCICSMIFMLCQLIDTILAVLVNKSSKSFLFCFVLSISKTNENSKLFFVQCVKRQSSLLYESGSFTDLINYAWRIVFYLSTKTHDFNFITKFWYASITLWWFLTFLLAFNKLKWMRSHAQRATTDYFDIKKIPFSFAPR